MTPQNKAALDSIRKELLSAERIVITAHVRPDGDSLGSEIGLARFLIALDKEVTILNSDQEPRTLSWLADMQPGGLLQVFEEGNLKQVEALAHADAIVVVDTGVEHRLGDVGPRIRKAQGRKFLIDHHPDPDSWFDLACVET
ncbi:MAG: DHH family phosphoesterase, partial [Rubricoccaceae bacterium]|nr:DHH family phosphoesterase [Rubricoccaceae bacterium]